MIGSKIPEYEPSITLEEIEHCFLHEPFTTYQLQLHQRSSKPTGRAYNIEEFLSLCESFDIRSGVGDVFEYPFITNNNTGRIEIVDDVAMRGTASPVVKLAFLNDCHNVMEKDQKSVYHSSKVAIHRRNSSFGKNVKFASDICLLCPVCDPFEDKATKDQLDQYFFHIANGEYENHLNNQHGLTSLGYKVRSPYLGLLKLYGEVCFSCLCPYIHTLSNGKEVPCGKFFKLNWADSSPMRGYLKHAIKQHNPQNPQNLKTTTSKICETTIPNFLPITDYSLELGGSPLGRDFKNLLLNNDAILFEYCVLSIQASDADWYDNIPPPETYPGGFIPRRIRQISNSGRLLELFVRNCIDLHGDIGYVEQPGLDFSLSDVYLYCILGQGGSQKKNNLDEKSLLWDTSTDSEEEDSQVDIKEQRGFCSVRNSLKYPDLLVEVLSNYIKNPERDVQLPLPLNDASSDKDTLSKSQLIDAKEIWQTIVKSQLFKDMKNGMYGFSNGEDDVRFRKNTNHKLF